MQKLISKPYLEKVLAERLSSSSHVISEAKAKLARNKYSSETSIFLSHKHGEDKIIEQAIALFTSIGVSVYVDWQDYGIPKSTDGSTAIRIKTKIKENDKFVLLATEDAIASKWCNWELGFGDACKFPNNIAIMAIANSQEGNFSGTEYLQTYPIITSEYSYITTDKYYVEFKGGKENLDDWLNKR